MNGQKNNTPKPRSSKSGAFLATQIDQRLMNQPRNTILELEKTEEKGII
ncbi:hypothetical protein VKA52_12375 [Halobacillus sp. HZG1]|nr:hypothetical protein [Halobacillus sp. HZG1]